MIKPYICAMGSGVIDTNTLIDTHSPTDAISLDLLMDLSVLVLQGLLVALPYRQDSHTGRVQATKRFVSKPLVAISGRILKLSGHTCSESG